MRTSVNISVRNPTPGPELDLVKGALASGIGIGRKGRTIWLQEPRMPTGFPDLVAVVSRTRSSPFNPVRSGLGIMAFRLLAHLYSVRLRTIAAIAGDLHFTERRVSRLATELEQAGLATVKVGCIRARPLSQTFLARKIIAIEAKVSNWRRALDQAIANTWFASESYILIPDSRAVEAASRCANEFGVGVLVFDGVAVVKIVNPVNHGIPSSYGSWMIHERALQESWHMSHVDPQWNPSGLSGRSNIAAYS